VRRRAGAATAGGYSNSGPRRTPAIDARSSRYGLCPQIVSVSRLHRTLRALAPGRHDPLLVSTNLVPGRAVRQASPERMPLGWKYNQYHASKLHSLLRGLTELLAANVQAGARPPRPLRDAAAASDGCVESRLSVYLTAL